jgi:hypothetical protein
MNSANLNIRISKGATFKNQNVLADRSFVLDYNLKR